MKSLIVESPFWAIVDLRQQIFNKFVQFTFVQIYCLRETISQKGHNTASDIAKIKRYIFYSQLL